MAWIKIILVILVLLRLLFRILQSPFWNFKQKEYIKAEWTVKELTVKNTPKLTKEEQFNFVDGKGGWTKIQTIFDIEEFPSAVLEYFIDIQPDEYLEHLKKNNPPTFWQEDIYESVEIKELISGYELKYYDRGNEISSKYFDTYEQLLRFLVYDRLTNIGQKYKKLLKKSYYKQAGIT